MPTNETASKFQTIALILFVAGLSAFGPFVTDFYLPTLPAQQSDFATTGPMVQLGLSATMWSLALGQLWIGPFSDRQGRRGPLIAILIVFSLSTLGAVYAPNIETFIAMRFLEGLGASGALVMSRSISADSKTGKELVTFMSIVGAVQGIAPITAPMLGSLIADFAGWRGIFLALLGIGLVLLAATVFWFKESLPVERRRTGQHGVWRMLLSDRLFLSVVAQQFLASAVLFGHIASSPFVFQEVFHFSAGIYSLIFGGLALAITLGALLSPRMSDPVIAMSRGAIGMTVASIWVSMAFWMELSAFWVIVGLGVLLVSLGLTLPAAMTFALMLHRANSGAAAALLGAVAFGAGGMVAPLTVLGSPETSVSVIFTISSVLLLLVARVMSRAWRRVREEMLGVDLSF